MEENPRDLQDVVATLRRQRVRQGDEMQVLECIINETGALANHSSAALVVTAARAIRSRALELHRVHGSVPRFVVEDLLQETIEGFERAAREQAQR